MPTDPTSQGGRRGHFHRGRRGPDRRGSERRNAPPQSTDQAPPREQPRRGDHVDVEQIMRDIRARIGQRPGIELTDPQVQELAARRLEAILDPRTTRPGLLEQLRRSAGIPAVTVPALTPEEPPYQFEDTTLYETHNPITRALRKLLNPVLKLFFNPNPLIRVLNIQSRLNVDASRREAERVQQQAEWNALHYEILQRLVTEVSRVSLEIQAMTLRVDSLATKVDFNERRVRGIEGALHQGRGAGGRETSGGRETAGGRETERQLSPPSVPVAVSTEAAPTAEAATPGEAPTGEAQPRRRRRRRRGRRGAGPPDATAVPGRPMPAGEAPEAEETEEGGEDEPVEVPAPRATEGAAASGTPELEFPQRDETPPSIETPAAEPERPPADTIVALPVPEPPPERGPDEQ
jgi:hypothetical protein